MGTDTDTAAPPAPAVDPYANHPLAAAHLERRIASLEHRQMSTLFTPRPAAGNDDMWVVLVAIVWFIVGAMIGQRVTTARRAGASDEGGTE